MMLEQLSEEERMSRCREYGNYLIRHPWRCLARMFFEPKYMSNLAKSLPERMGDGTAIHRTPIRIASAAVEALRLSAYSYLVYKIADHFLNH